MTSQKLWDYISTHQDDLCKDVAQVFKCPSDTIKLLMLEWAMGNRTTFDEIVSKNWADIEHKKNVDHLETDEPIIYDDKGGNGFSDLM